MPTNSQISFPSRNGGCNSFPECGLVLVTASNKKAKTEVTVYGFEEQIIKSTTSSFFFILLNHCLEEDPANGHPGS